MMKLCRLRARILLVAFFALAGVGLGVIASTGPNLEMEAHTRSGSPRLIAYEPLPGMDGTMCQWVPASVTSPYVAVLNQESMPASIGSQADGRGNPTAEARAAAAQLQPERVIRDVYPAFSGIAVDPVRNEVVMTEENLFSIMVYDRLENTPSQATMSEPKRMIRGMKTEIEFQCSVYVDPASGDIYATNNDTLGKLVVFSRDARGDVPPTRELYTPHTTFGIAVDEKSQEMFLTIQDDAAVVVYRKMAEGDEGPIRLLQGDRTLLADPHGIALDSESDLLFVSNWGSVNTHRAPKTGPRIGTLLRGSGVENWPVGRNYTVPGSGRFLPPSITVYPRTASGDTPPLRVIQGPQSQLDWPTAMAVHPERGELFVANDTGDSVLVFRTNAEGDAAPTRVLKGPNTLIKNPTGLALDLKNNELWVTNFANHTATVFPITASGDTPPLRVIRSAPLDQPAPIIGNPHTIRYDTKREEILVAN